MRGDSAPGLLVVALLPLLCTTCALLGGHPARCPVALVPSWALPEGLFLRSRMQLATPEREFHLEVVALAEGGDLLVVGLAPFGIRLFAIRQRGREHWIEEHAASQLAPPPVWVLDALHRIHWIAPPPGVRAQEHRSWEREGERVSDWLDHGRLRHREFARGGRGGRQDSDARVSIDYPDTDDERSPGAITILNRWCGYQGQLVTLEAAPGAPAPAESGRP